MRNIILAALIAGSGVIGAIQSCGSADFYGDSAKDVRQVVQPGVSSEAPKEPSPYHEPVNDQTDKPKATVDRRPGQSPSQKSGQNPQQMSQPASSPVQADAVRIHIDKDSYQLGECNLAGDDLRDILQSWSADDDQPIDLYCGSFAAGSRLLDQARKMN